MRTLILLSVLSVLVASFRIARAVDAPATRPVAERPRPELSPKEVVGILVEAMRTNPPDDAGIATVFEFASPQNREVTGPLERFVPLVKTPGYAPMLNCKAVEMGPGSVSDNVARQFVKLTAADGSVAIYLFVLSKQAEVPYKDCWMTDGVVRVDGPATQPAGEETPDVPTERI